MSANIFSRFFTYGDEEADASVRNAAREVLTVASHPYMATLLEYLDDEAGKPLNESDAMEIVKFAVRANTYREVRKKILRDISQAKAVMAHQEE